MQENFDLNRRSISGEGYRKNLSDKLKKMGKKEAQNELFLEQNKELVNDTNQYEKEKIEQKAQWIIAKYLSEPDLFRMEDSLSLEERQNKIDEVLNQKLAELEGVGGVVDKYKKKVYELVSRIIKENDFDNNPNLEHFKREHSDIILQKNSKSGEEKNKFILLALRTHDMNRNIFFDIAIGSFNDSSANKEDVLPCLKSLSGHYPDEISKIKYFSEMIFRGTTENNVIIARPMTNRVFNQHYELNNKFKREHKDYAEDKRTSRGYHTKNPSLIFGEEKKEEIENFVKGFIEIIENETDYDVAMEKLKNLPKPTDLKATYSVLSGGYVSLEEGKLYFYGKSEVYGYSFYDRGELLRLSLEKDFTEEELNYNNLR